MPGNGGAAPGLIWSPVGTCSECATPRGSAPCGCVDTVASGCHAMSSVRPRGIQHSTMAGATWARLQADVKCRLRRGAWYRVIQLRAREAILDVGRTPVSVARSALQLSSTPPSQWTVVSDPRNAAGLPPHLIEYAVCPSCRSRAPFDEHPATMRCPRCNGLFAVAWNEAHAAIGAERRRMPERRVLLHRRSGLERRIADRRRTSVPVSRGRRRGVSRRRGRDRRDGSDRRERRA